MLKGRIPECTRKTPEEASQGSPAPVCPVDLLHGHPQGGSAAPAAGVVSAWRLQGLPLPFGPAPSQPALRLSQTQFPHRCQETTELPPPPLREDTRALGTSRNPPVKARSRGGSLASLRRCVTPI